MPKYGVIFTYNGKAIITVNANSKSDAVRKARSKCANMTHKQFTADLTPQITRAYAIAMPPK